MLDNNLSSIKCVRNYFFLFSFVSLKIVWFKSLNFCCFTIQKSASLPPYESYYLELKGIPGYYFHLLNSIGLYLLDSLVAPWKRLLGLAMEISLFRGSKLNPRGKMWLLPYITASEPHSWKWMQVLLNPSQSSGPFRKRAFDEPAHVLA